MSNPTNGVWQFEDSLVGQDRSGATAFTMDTGPERYDDGLWLEEGTTNELANPSFETDTTGWANNNTGNTISRVTSDASDGSASLHVIGDGSVSQQGTSNSGSSPAAATGEKWALSADIYAVGGETVRFVASERNSGGGLVLDTQGPTLTLAAGWHRRNFAATLAGGGTVAQVRFKFFTPTAQAIDLNLDACQLEKKPYATSYTAGTRAASSASVPTAGIISPNSGSLAFRFTRKLDTGTLEPILEVGENAAGYDHLQIFIDADTLWVAWDSEGALPQTIDTGHTMVVDQEYFIYTYWDGLVFGVSIDNGTPVIANRDVPTGDWGTNPLTLAAE